MTQPLPPIRKLPYELGSQIGQTARLGLIALQSDERIEADLRSVMPEGDEHAAFVSRIPSGNDVTLSSLESMSTELTHAASLLPPSISFDVIGYGCTSASSVLGSQKVAMLVKEGRDTSYVTDPLNALIAACAHLGITRLAVLTPYLADVTHSLIGSLADAGIFCTTVGAFEESSEERVAKIASGSLADAVQSLDRERAAEAIFLSCTNLNTFGIIQTLEDTLSVPVFSSNQVLFWHMARLSAAKLKGPGRLFHHL